MVELSIKDEMTVIARNVRWLLDVVKRRRRASSDEIDTHEDELLRAFGGIQIVLGDNGGDVIADVEMDE
jgi:hypothetical protein